MNAPSPPEDTRQPPRDFFPTFRKLFRWIFSWRMLRACLFALVCLVTLIGLFYAVENWRGRWAWHRYTRELEAKGEKLDWQSFVPPPVPDDQNFAMTPLLKPVLDFESRRDASDRRIRWRDTNGINRLWSLVLQRAEVATNPPGVTGKWQTGQRIDLAAWQAYFRLAPSVPKKPPSPAPASTNRFPVAPQPQTPAADVLLALSRFDPELAELHAARARPYTRFPVHYGEGLSTMLPHLGILQNVSQIATLRAVAGLEADRSEPAFQDVTLSFHLADALRVEPFCISHLVRLAILDRSLQAVSEGLAMHRWSSNQLNSLTDYLRTVDLLSDYSRVVRSERSLGGIAYTFADRDRRTELLLNMFPSGALHSGFTGMLRYYPKGWFYLNDRAAGRFYQEKALPLINPAERRAYPTRARAVLREFEEAPARPGNAVFQFFGPFLPPMQFTRAQTHLDLARVACALERYWQAHREFPGTLDVLAPAYLDPLPRDIITGQPFKYRRTPDGQFVLHSVGWDETDDGGRFPSPVENPQNAQRAAAMWSWKVDEEETGDWVWRYPAIRMAPADGKPGTNTGTMRSES